MIVTTTEDGAKFVEQLRKIIELPQNLIDLEIRVSRNSVVEVNCTYYPDAKTPGADE